MLGPYILTKVIGTEYNSPTNIRYLPSLSDIVDLWVKGVPFLNNIATPLALIAQVA